MRKQICVVLHGRKTKFSTSKYDVQALILNDFQTPRLLITKRLGSTGHIKSPNVPDPDIEGGDAAYSVL